MTGETTFKSTGDFRHDLLVAMSELCRRSTTGHLREDEIPNILGYPDSIVSYIFYRLLGAWKNLWIEVGVFVDTICSPEDVCSIYGYHFKRLEPWVDIINNKTNAEGQQNWNYWDSRNLTDASFKMGVVLFLSSIFALLLQIIKLREELLDKRSGYNMNKELVFSYQLLNDPFIQAIITGYSSSLKIKLDELLRMKLEEDISKISLPAIDSANHIQIGTFFYENLKAACDKLPHLLSYGKFAETKYDPKVIKEIENIPNATRCKAIDALIPPGMRKRANRLRSEGLSEEQINKIMLQNPHWRAFYNLNKPDPIVITETDEGDIESSIPEHYLATPEDEQADALASHEETQKVVLAIKKWANNKPESVKAYMNYLLENRDNEETKFSNREIARTTGFHEDVISRTRKFLKKDPVILELLHSLLSCDS